MSWRKLANLRPSPAIKRRRRILGTLSILLLIVLLFVVMRFLAFATAVNDQLFVRIGDQQVATIDTRQSVAISPNLFGANIFPQVGTTSVDNAHGTIYYSEPLPQNLANARIHLLRFPGGSWGEAHYLSFDQLSNFTALLQQTGADGMIQARLSD
ncbi:MAG: hypothetical protein M3Z24_16045, partial [Chloroflexota bacterium]|nr:hypothetical protein [Chloroflexota bacterium]